MKCIFCNENLMPTFDIVWLCKNHKGTYINYIINKNDNIMAIEYAFSYNNETFVYRFEFLSNKTMINDSKSYFNRIIFQSNNIDPIDPITLSSKLPLIFSLKQ